MGQQGMGRGWQGVGAIIFICDTQYQLNTHCFKRYSIGLPSYGLHLENLLNECNAEKQEDII